MVLLPETQIQNKLVSGCVRMGNAGGEGRCLEGDEGSHRMKASLEQKRTWTKGIHSMVTEEENPREQSARSGGDDDT